MRFSFWTEKLRQRMAGLSIRRRGSDFRGLGAGGTLGQPAERCEERCLPSVSALLFTDPFNPALQDLTILCDGPDDITVTVSGGNVQILVGQNGGPQTTLLGQPTVAPSALARIDVLASDATNRIALPGVTTANGFSASLAVNVEAGDSNDLVDATSSDIAVSLVGGNGTDTITGGTANDTLLGGDGADLITGGVGNDSLLGGHGADTVNGGVGLDTLHGGDGADLLNAGDDNDSVFGANGADNIDGGLGDDTLNGDGGNDTVNGNTGNDTLLGGADQDSLLGGDGDDVINAQGGNDTVLSGSGADSVEGGAGNDSILGHDGNDFVNAGLGHDTVLGNDGDDTIQGGAGNDQLSGDASDSFSSDSGNDLVLGQGGNDTLSAGIGADTLDGGDGDDLVSAARQALPPPPPPPPPTPPSVFINDITLAAEGNVGTTSAVFTVSLSHSSTSTITINFATADGLAIAGTDYQAASSTLTFAPGVTTQTITIQVNGDVQGEPAEDFTVSLSGAVGATLLDSSGRAIIPAEDQTLTSIPVDPFYAADYTAVSLGSIPGLPPLYGGLTIDPANPNFLLVGGNANTSAGALYRIPVLRDAYGHISGLTGTATLFAAAPYNDGGVVFGPNGVLFAARWPVNELGQYLPGATAPTRVIDMAPLGVTNSLSALQFVPVGFGGAGQMKLVTWPNGDFYNATYSSAGDGTFNITSVTQVATVPGGPEGIVYVPQGSPQFATASMLIAEFSNGQVSSYQVDGNGNPVVATRRPFLSSLTGAEGAFIDPISGDFLFTTFGGGNQLVVVQGFASTVPTLSIDDVSLVEGDAGTVSATFTVTATGTLTSTVTVDYLTGDGTASGNQDFASATGQLTFGPGVTTQTVTITVSGDTFDEPNEAFFVNLFNASGATIGDNQGVGTIVDDDPSIPQDLLPDLLRGGIGNDTLIGSGNNDTINGESGSDSVLAGDGNDLVFGGSGPDTLNGEGGNDTLNGQGGNDLLNGGTGDDQLVWTGASGASDTVSGTTGFDTAVVNGTGLADTLVVGQDASGQMIVTDSGFTLTIQSTITNVVINANGGDDVITIGSLDTVTGTVLTINGGEGNDILDASGAVLGLVRMALNGQAGDDTLTGGDGSDTLDGGDGNDELAAGAGNDSVLGGAGDDVLNGEDGNDTLNGGDGDDFATGGNGNDNVRGGDGNDTLQGQAGNDSLTGETGDDSLVDTTGNDSLVGGNGFDTLDSGDGNDTLDGGFGDDSLTAGAGSDKLRGGDGNDTLDGGDGDDELNAGDGDDQLIGGAGNDGLSGGDGDDLVNGGAGNDVITGNDGNDSLLGGSGADTLLGGDGDDSINGQGGADIVAGNEGVDTLTTDASDSVNEAFVLSQTLLDRLDGV